MTDPICVYYPKSSFHHSLVCETRSRHSQNHYSKSYLDSFGKDLQVQPSKQQSVLKSTSLKEV